jgi:site-specific recombinase XerD
MGETSKGGQLVVPAAVELGAAGEAEERIRGYIAGARSENTRRAYAADWATFETWCAAEGFPSLPASPGAVCRFLDHLVAEGYSDRSGKRRSYSVSTLSRFMASISVAHGRAGFGLAENPVKHPAVQECWEGVRRAVGSAQRRKSAATTPIVRAMVAGLPDPVAPLPGAADRSQLAGLRDRALVLVGFAGAFRRSELAALAVEDLEDVDEGVDVLIRRSKTDQAGEGEMVLIVYAPAAKDCPVRALRAWLAASGITQGPIFRKIDRNGAVGARALSGQAVADVVKARAKAAGRDPAKFAGHSLRRGHVTSARKGGAAQRKIRAQTGHRSDRMLDIYTEDASRSEGNSSAAIWNVP